VCVRVVCACVWCVRACGVCVRVVCACAWCVRARGVLRGAWCAMCGARAFEYCGGTTLFLGLLNN
jgi:hypothetical protein